METQDWQTVLQATVDMRSEANLYIASDDLATKQYGLNMHAVASKIATNWRCK